jgi:hypothetical protein
MKTCNRFHIEDVEPGDRLHFSGGPGSREWTGPEEFVVTVKRTFKTNRFGWIIDTANEVNTENSFYVNDGWIIREEKNS